jgi:hypothetical protein
MPTITDQQAQEIQRRLKEGEDAKLALRGAQELWNDEKLGREAKRLWKQKWPEAQIEGFDQEERLDQKITAFDKAREDEKREADLKARTEALAAKRKSTQEQHGYTDDAMKRMDEMMHERDIYDYDAAHLLFAAQNPKPSDASADGHYWNHEKQPAFKEIAADPERWGHGELVKVLRQQEQQRNKF